MSDLRSVGSRLGLGTLAAGPPLRVRVRVRVRVRLGLGTPAAGPAAGTVLHCTVLYCTVLHCKVLYCKVLY